LNCDTKIQRFTEPLMITNSPKTGVVIKEERSEPKNWS